MEDRQTVTSSAFFTGVSLTIEPPRLRQHFESVGHVIKFDTYGPAPGKDFRYGIVTYMDPQTAEEAIRRLNGTTFGERAMRVTPARTTILHAPGRAGPGGGGSGPVGQPPFHKREREGFVPERGRGGGPGGFQPGSFRGGIRGRGRGSFSSRVPMVPRQPALAPTQNVDKDGRSLMQLPPTFLDPVLGRDVSPVLHTLRGMATEDVYAAVEQLRVLALERPQEAKALLQNNPALKSAVVVTLQHAGRMAPGFLPAEAYRAPKNVAKKEEPQLQPQPTVKDKEGGEAEGTAVPPQHTDPSNPGSSTTTAAMTPAFPPPSSAAVKSMPISAPPAPTTAAAAPKKSKKAAAAPAPMTEQERDDVLQLIQNMGEEDVDRVLTMSVRDLAQVPDVAQRKQLELLQRRLLEMSQDL